MKESKIRLALETFFRRMYKYCFMFEEKKDGQKVDVLVQLISCRNLFYNFPFAFLTILLFLFSLLRKAESFSHKKEIKTING